jgi:hypothetical protein
LQEWLESVTDRDGEVAGGFTSIIGTNLCEKMDLSQVQCILMSSLLAISNIEDISKSMPTDMTTYSL